MVGGDEQAVDVVVDDVDEAVGAGGDDGQSGGHSFGGGEAEPFPFAGHEEEVGGFE